MRHTRDCYICGKLIVEIISLTPAMVLNIDRVEEECECSCTEEDRIAYDELEA